MSNALKRLATLAEDEHKNDPGKAIEHYYSAALAKTIKDAKYKFDVSYLDGEGETGNGSGPANVDDDEEAEREAGSMESTAETENDPTHSDKDRDGESNASSTDGA